MGNAVFLGSKVRPKIKQYGQHVGSEDAALDDQVEFLVEGHLGGIDHGEVALEGVLHPHVFEPNAVLITDLLEEAFVAEDDRVDQFFRLGARKGLEDIDIGDIDQRRADPPLAGLLFGPVQNL